MSQARRVSSRNSTSNGRDKNKSNSNLVKPNSVAPRKDDFAITRPQSSETNKQSQMAQFGRQGMKVLGQDAEMTAEELFEQDRVDRLTPLSNRSKTGSRPASNISRRTPTPVKQVSLQAVKRKEERDYPLETIDWNDFNQPVDIPNERVPPISSSDSESEDLSPLDLRMSADEQRALVEQREREMASALTTHRPDQEEISIVQKLEVIEQEREEREKREKQAADLLLREIERIEIEEEEEQKYTNDHYRNLSHRDVKNSIDSSFILEGRDKKSVKPETSRSEAFVGVGSQPEVRKGENVIGRHPMDSNQETAIETEPEPIKAPAESDSTNKDADDKASSSDDDSDDEEDDNDLIGHKGKAPNHLLMEFLSCLMEEDYENAEKLCKMVLIYEPENPEALNFLPVIQAKRVQEAEESSEEETDSEEESDDSGADDDDDDDDDENDDDDDDDDDDDEEEESSEDEEEQSRHPDSGIASANSD